MRQAEIEKRLNYQGSKQSESRSGYSSTWGVMAALAGLVLAARLNAATPQAGTSMELDAMAAVYFGGASTSGGIGTIMGAIVGGLVMGVLNNGMSILGVGVDWQQAIKGLILLLAVVLDLYNKKKRTT